MMGGGWNWLRIMSRRLYIEYNYRIFLGTPFKSDEGDDFHGYGTVMIGSAANHNHYQCHDMYSVRHLSSFHLAALSLS
jgi:hypothetical protein